MFINTVRKVVASVLEGNAPDIEKEWCKYLVERALEERQQITDSFRIAYKELSGNVLEDPQKMKPKKAVAGDAAPCGASHLNGGAQCRPSLDY